MELLNSGGNILKKRKSNIVKEFAFYYFTCTWLQVLQLVFISISLGNSIAEAYHWESKWIINWIEVVTTVAFIVDYVLSIAYSAVPMKYILSLEGVLDFITWLPFFLSLIFNHNSLIQLIRVLKCIRILKFYRVLRVEGSLDRSTDTLLRYNIIKFFFNIIAITFIATGVIASLQGITNKYGFSDIDGDHVELPWHDSFYFVIVSLSTVGYGEITPQLASSRIVVIAFLLITLILATYHAVKLLNAFEERPKYKTGYNFCNFNVSM